MQEKPYQSKSLPKLKAGEPVVGSWLNTGSSVVAELMAGCGFDFLTVDIEHAAIDLPETLQIFQGIRSGNPECDCMVRLHGVDYAHVKRFLDAGANGVIAPLVESKEDAELLVAATKYPPFGRRGVGFCRGNQYGRNIVEYVEEANDEILVAVQIESAAGVERIDEILSVKGIDAVFLGPYDLSASLGVTGQFDHPEFLAARERVLSVCKEKGVAPGIHVVQPNPEEFLERASEGYRLLAYSLDITMLLKACQDGLGVIREKLG